MGDSSSSAADENNATRSLGEEVARVVELGKDLQDSAASFISRTSREEDSLRQRALALNSTIQRLRSSVASSNFDSRDVDKVMEQSQQLDNSGQNERISWRNTELLKFYLEICIEEVNLCGRAGTSLKAESWSRVAKAIKQRFGLTANQKQLKNQYDFLKERYQYWAILVGKTGNTCYNYETNTFNLTNEQWDDFLKAYPKVRPLKSNGLPFSDLCTKLFEGAFATGSKAWGPACSTPRPGANEVIPSLELPGIGENNFNNEDVNPDTPSPRVNSTVNNSRNDEGDKNDGGVKNDDKKRKKRKRDQSSNSIDEKMSKVLDLIIEKNKGPSIDDCIEKLKTFGWDEEDPLYMTAMCIFCEGGNYGSIWMKLPNNSNVVATWIKTVGRKLKFYHD